MIPVARVRVVFTPLVVFVRVVAAVLVKLSEFAELSALKLMFSAPDTFSGPRMVRTSAEFGTTAPDQLAGVFQVPLVAIVQLYGAA